MGSKSVISRAYATTEPAAEPLPGPTGISCVFAKWMKSQVIKKYAENPIFSIIPSSYFTRSLSSGVISSSLYFLLRPCITSSSK